MKQEEPGIFQIIERLEEATEALQGKTHTGRKNYNCPKCTKTFNSVQNLKAHMKSHTGDNHNFSCTACSKNFKRSEHLKRHMNIHTGEKPFSCPLCFKSFSRADRLGLHRAAHTGESLYNVQYRYVLSRSNMHTT